MELTSLPDTCSAEELAKLLPELVSAFGVSGLPPDLRTLRLWRTKGRITITGRRFTRRNVLEVLTIMHLRDGGQTLQAASGQVQTMNEERLHTMLSIIRQQPINRINTEAQITLDLLAKGILAQYRQITKGAIVGHTDTYKTGVKNTPESLHQAMTRLSRHYLMEGAEDHASSVHHLLTLCMKKIEDWAPRVIVELPHAAEAVLIDSDYRVPSEDCEAIAEQADGFNLSDLIEHQLHSDLRATIGQLGADADRAYTAIRSFIGRHPLALRSEFLELASDPEIPHVATSFVTSLYDPVHAVYARNGSVQRCVYCQSLLQVNGRCTLAGCTADHPISRGSPITLNDALLARPEVLKYWADPAREELRLFDALRAIPSIRDRVQLYPHSDRCDVSIGDEIGIDVKDYRDPERLAQRLNRSIGGLSHYPTRYLVIAQRRWVSKNYGDRLRDQLTPELRSTVTILSVNDAIAQLTSGA